MASSLTMMPLRAAARHLRFAPPTRGVATVMPRRLLTKSAPRPLAAASTPPASTPTKPPTPTRTPIPAVSGAPLPDAPDSGSGNSDVIDWSQSYHGLGTSAFPPEVAAILQSPLNPDDIEVKPDGIIYLPEIKYRRILNSAFGPGGWGLAPRGDLIVKERLVAREYALIVHGRFVGQARGEQQYFTEDGIPTAAEGCKSNALMRCCKDLGIASELWDPRFIRNFMKTHAVQQWAEHVTTKKKKQIWLRRDDELRYPWKKS
ncbi:mitochondrial genome maintenance MGM101-domain-containing protein [Biscogniauxia sp. FL1348]|nr:mitochondrial genome maintenance MGM101-domain-containing protein [Biscogniauxia sp. FL1348]